MELALGSKGATEAETDFSGSLEIPDGEKTYWFMFPNVRNQNCTKNPKIQTWFEDIFEYFFASKYAGSMQLAELGQSRTLFILVDGGYTYL